MPQKSTLAPFRIGRVISMLTSRHLGCRSELMRVTPARLATGSRVLQDAAGDLKSTMMRWHSLRLTPRPLNLFLESLPEEPRSGHWTLAQRDPAQAHGRKSICLPGPGADLLGLLNSIGLLQE